MPEPRTWAIARLARRIARRLRRRTVERAMTDEMQYHVECETAERVRAGATPDEARRSAMRDFGGIDVHKEAARDAFGLRAADHAMRDVSYALRVLRRNPGFALAVIATFALGVGCTTSVFTLVRGILLRPLPYERPSELVAVWESSPSRGVDRNVVSADTFDTWRERARSFTSLAAMVPAPRTIAGSSAERTSLAQVSASFFSILGIHPALGRDLSADDEANGGAAVVILSDAVWRSRFGANPAAVGTTVVMDDTPYTIVGVMPASFEPPQFGWMSEEPMWIPFGVTPENKRWGRFLQVIGRRRPGVTTGEAAAEVATIATQLAEEGRVSAEWSATAIPLAQQINGDVRRPLLVIFAVVILLFAMASVNVASLLATFSRRRERELIMRRALGATRGRLIAQQVTLSLVLGLVGTAVGIALAFAATRALIAVMPPGVPRLADIKVDPTVLGAAIAASASTMLVVGVITAVRSLRRLHAPGVGSRVTWRLGGAQLVVAEVAIGVVVSVFAVLMVRSVINLRSVDLGFQSRSVVTARISLPFARYPRPEFARTFFDDLLARIRAAPGVDVASVATTRPFACCAPATPAWDASRGPDAERDAPTTDVRIVDAAYFSALRIPLVAGELLSPTESAQGPPRTVVTQSLARALWGNANPVGRRVALNFYGTTTAEVIGVVGDIHLADPRTPPRPALFLSTARFPSSERDVIVRGQGDEAELLSVVRHALEAADATVPLYRPAALEASVSETTAQDRFTAELLTAFALLALALASVGVYGVLSGDVARRRQEIGVRLALGADPVRVLALVLGRALPPALTGVAIGIAVALVLTRSMSALVFGVETSDAASFSGAAGLLLGVAVLATLGPAVRAMRVSAVEVIRGE